MRYPEWVIEKTTYYLSEDEKDKYYKPEFYQRSSGRSGDYPRPGYNPNHDSIVVEQIRLDTDELNLLPY